MLHQLEDESNEEYNYRCEFFNKFKQNNPSEKDKQIIIYSKMLANMKYKKCKYEPKHYHKLKQYLN